MRLSRSATFRGLTVIAVLVLTGAVLLVLPVVRASQQSQQGGSKWWQTHKRELALTDEQSSKIEAIFQASIPQFRKSKDDLDRLEDTLSKMIADGVAGEPAVIEQVDRVEAARSALSKMRTLMLYRMRQVLTPEQRAKLTVLHEHQKQRDRDRGKKPGNQGR